MQVAVDQRERSRRSGRGGSHSEVTKVAGKTVPLRALLAEETASYLSLTLPLSSCVSQTF